MGGGSFGEWEEATVRQQEDKQEGSRGTLPHTTGLPGAHRSLELWSRSHLEGNQGSTDVLFSAFGPQDFTRLSHPHMAYLGLQFTDKVSWSFSMSV